MEYGCGGLCAGEGLTERTLGRFGDGRTEVIGQATPSGASARSMIRAMLKKYANYAIAGLFLLTALRDWFFPGRLQIHAGTGTPWASFLLGGFFFLHALRETGQAKRLNPFI